MKSIKLNRLGHGTWSQEVWALVGSLAALIALVTLLAVFDGKSAFQWHSITLNTIVSIISVVMKVFIIFSVGECIGQWKWIVFSRGQRQLMDFERIDLASRGPLGSLYLVWRRDTPIVLRLGVVLILLGIAIDPLSQQLVQLEAGIRFTDDFHGQQVLNPFAEKYTSGSLKINGVHNSSYVPPQDMVPEIPFNMEMAIAGALSLNQSVDTTMQRLGLSCPTGNCTWDEFNTLGVCHRCNDLTGELKTISNIGLGLNGSFEVQAPWNVSTLRQLNTTTYVLPNGHILSNIDSCPVSYPCTFDADGNYVEPISNIPGYSHFTVPFTSFGTGNVSLTNSMHDLSTMIWSMSAIYVDRHQWNRVDIKMSNGTPEYVHEEDAWWRRWSKAPIMAHECSLYYCVQSIKSEVTGSRIQERVRELKDAVRDPDSWKPAGLNYKAPDEPVDFDDWSDEDVESLEFRQENSKVWRTELGLFFPDRPSEPLYNISQEAVDSISFHLQQAFIEKGLVSAESLEKLARKTGNESAVVFNGAADPSALGSPSQPRYVSAFTQADHSNFTTTFEKLAMAMTNTIRQDGLVQVGSAGDSFESGLKGGHIGIQVTVYRVEWYWIWIHALMIVGSTAFCLATIIVSNKAPVKAWKSSALAAINAGISLAEGLDSTMTTKQMEKTARRKEVVIPENQVFKVLSNSESNSDTAEPALPPALSRSLTHLTV